MRSDYAIDVRELTVNFGAHVAVNDLTLQVPTGSIYALIGPNGSGKTTTIRAILGLLKPKEGEIRVLGAHLSEHRQTIFERVGVLFDHAWLYPHLSADENLQVACLSHGIKRGTRALLKRVGLAAAGSRRVRYFSAGMKQRLGMAMALLNDPELLILDEPLNGLDAAAVGEFRTLMQKLASEGRTIFWSSHQLNEVQRISSHVGFISAGRSLFEGKMSELIKPSGKILVTLANPPSAKQVELIKQSLAANGFPPLDIEQAPGGLEDAWVSLTGRTEI